MFNLFYGEDPHAALVRNLGGRRPKSNAVREVIDLLVGRAAIMTGKPKQSEELGEAVALIIIGRIERLQWFAPEWHVAISGMNLVMGPGDEIRSYEDNESFNLTVHLRNGASGLITPVMTPPPMTEEELTQIASEIYGTTPAILKGGGGS